MSEQHGRVQCASCHDVISVCHCAKCSVPPGCYAITWVTCEKCKLDRQMSREQSLRVQLHSALDRVSELQAELGKLYDEQAKELDAGAAAMNEAAERLVVMNQCLRKLEDCEQDGPVCASPAPGCMRHMLMCNRELLDERNHVLERIAALEAKIAKSGEERAHDTVAW